MGDPISKYLLNPLVFVIGVFILPAVARFVHISGVFHEKCPKGVPESMGASNAPFPLRNVSTSGLKREDICNYKDISSPIYLRPLYTRWHNNS